MLYKKNPKQIEVTVLEGYSRPPRNKLCIRDNDERRPSWMWPNPENLSIDRIVDNTIDLTFRGEI